MAHCLGYGGCQQTVQVQHSMANERWETCIDSSGSVRHKVGAEAEYDHVKQQSAHEIFMQESGIGSHNHAFLTTHLRGCVALIVFVAVAGGDPALLGLAHLSAHLFSEKVGLEPKVSLLESELASC